MAVRLETEFVNRRNDGNERLEYLIELSSRRHDIVDEVLRVYDVPKIGYLSYQERYDKAMQLIAGDYLLSVFYDEDGDLSYYGSLWRQMYDEINPAHYVYAGVLGNWALEWLHKFVDVSEGESVVERYILDFTTSNWPPVIVTPGFVYIDEEEKRVKFSWESSFIPPFGEGSTNITLYRHVSHRIGEK